MSQCQERSFWCTRCTTTMTNIHMSSSVWPHIARGHESFTPQTLQQRCMSFSILHIESDACWTAEGLERTDLTALEAWKFMSATKQQRPSKTLQAFDISSFTLHFLPCLTAPSRHLADPQRTQLLSLCGQVAAVTHVGPSLSCTTPADNSSENYAAFWQRELGTMHSITAFLAYLRFASSTDLHSRSHRMCSPRITAVDAAQNHVLCTLRAAHIHVLQWSDAAFMRI